MRSIAVEQSNCGLRQSIPNVSPVAVQGTRLKIGGRAHAEQWLCAGPLKTRMVEADADFVIGLWPVANERAVTVSAELEMFDVDGVWSSISDELRKALSSSLSRMAEGMKFNFPPEIADLNPRFTDAQLADLGNGRGELDIEASVIIRAADMARLIALMTK